MSTPVKQIKLSNVLTEIIDKTEEDGKYRVLTSSQRGIVSQEEYFNKKVASRDTSGYKIIRKGQFTYRAMSDTGRFYINRLDDFDIGIVSPAYPVFEIKDDNEVSSDYLTAFFKSEKFQSDIAHMYTGSTRASLKFKNIRDVVVNVPDKEEQKKRLNVLRIIDRELSILGEIENKLDDSVKSRFIEMFGDSNKTCKLGEVCTKITDGTHKTPNYLAEGITFISAKNIVNGELDYSDVKHISEEEYSEIQKRCGTEKYDILLSKSGSLGQPAIIKTDEKLGLFESLAVIKYDRNKLIPEFLKEQLKSDHVQWQFSMSEKGVAVKHLHLEVIKNIDIVLPDIGLQKEFASFVDQIDKSKLAVQEMKNKMEILKASVMQEYFC